MICLALAALALALPGHHPRCPRQHAGARAQVHVRVAWPKSKPARPRTPAPAAPPPAAGPPPTSAEPSEGVFGQAEAEEQAREEAAGEWVE